jgi:hypothetical protein
MIHVLIFLLCVYLMIGLIGRHLTFSLLALAGAAVVIVVVGALFIALTH